MNSDGSGTAQLTDNYSDDQNPTWSPDGSQIAFQSSDGLFDDSEIYVIDVEGKSISQLTDNPYEDFDPAWSPDGSRIAFGSDRYGVHGIFVMDPDGSDVVQLTGHAAGSLGLHGRRMAIGSRFTPAATATIMIFTL